MIYVWGDGQGAGFTCAVRRHIKKHIFGLNYRRVKSLTCGTFIEWAVVSCLGDAILDYAAVSVQAEAGEVSAKQGYFMGQKRRGKPFFS